MANFYDVLGVARDASLEDIKKAYRKLSKELHPDKHKGDKAAEKKYQEVNEAYETLSDPKKRQMYDQFGNAKGPAGFDASGFQGFGGQDFGNISDLFESFFGGRPSTSSGRPADERGRDIEVQITIDFSEAVSGARQTLRLRRRRLCKTCNGNGAAPGSKLIPCKTCGGTGQVVRSAASFFGNIQQTVICPECRGRGQVPGKTCRDCGGEGRREIEETVTVNIPAGIDEGQTLRLRHEGQAGRNGKPAGDLYVRIAVRPDKRFERDGDHVRATLTISVLEAILGTQRKIPTVYGDVTLSIPAGSQPGQVLRLKSKGMPVLNTSRHGDHYVTLNIEIPQHLSRKERKLLEDWKAISL